MVWVAVDADSDGKIDDLNRSWRVNAARWSEAVRRGKIESRKAITDQAIISTVLRYKPSHILDVGCGEGWLCRALSHAAQCVGVDASCDLVKMALDSGGARFIEMDYERLRNQPNAAGTAFDVIVANFSLLDDRTADLLSALAEAGTSHARLIIQTVHPLTIGGEYRDGWRTETFRNFGDENWAPMPWFFRTLESWISVINGRWSLEAILEPSLPGDSSPTSLILVARKYITQ